MQRINSKRSEPSWPRLVVKKFLNVQDAADEFSADEDDENPGYSMGNITNIRRYSESGLSSTHVTYSQECSIFVGTWNVAGKPPSDKIGLKEWLDSRKGVDIYVIGFQEVVPLNPANVLGAEDEGPATKWEALIRQTLNSDARQTKSAPTSPWRQEKLGASSQEHNQAEKHPELHSKHRRAHSISDLNLNSAKFMPNGSTMSDTGSSATSNASQKNGKSYVRIISKQMVGIFVTVWIRKDLRRYIHDVKVSCVGCGLMGYYGNKGSVSVSMMFDQTSFCFVCTHLTSGEREGDELRRNSDVIEILKRTIFPRSSSHLGPESILEHDRIIWLGDLNYRLSLSNGDTRALVAEEHWDALLQKDQLKVEQNLGGVFHGWREGTIEFAPTYKYKANSNEYSNGEKQRTPAWCDRILWLGKGLKQMDYLRTEYTFSDHRPVSALFVAEVDILKRRGPLRTASDAFTLELKRMQTRISLYTMEEEEVQAKVRAPSDPFVKRLGDSSVILPL